MYNVILFFQNLILFILAAQRGLWDLSSPTRDQTQASTHTHTVEEQSPNHWTPREFPQHFIYKSAYISLKRYVKGWLLKF